MKNMSIKFKYSYLAAGVVALCLVGCQNSGAKGIEKGEFVEMFNGENLDGWKGDTTIWSVENGNLVGELTENTSLESNSFLIWQEAKPSDFELKGEFRISKDGNSGINYRSARVDSIPYSLKGYQADIDGKNTYSGQIYEERGRTTLAFRGEEVIVNKLDQHSGSLKDNVKDYVWTHKTVTASLGNPDSLDALIKKGDWNRMQLVVKGNRSQYYINGVLMSDVTDKDSTLGKSAGIIGIQVHVGPPMKVEYRDLKLKKL